MKAIPFIKILIAFAAENKIPMDLNNWESIVRTSIIYKNKKMETIIIKCIWIATLLTTIVYGCGLIVFLGLTLTTFHPDDEKQTKKQVLKEVLSCFVWPLIWISLYVQEKRDECNY